MPSKQLPAGLACLLLAAAAPLGAQVTTCEEFLERSTPRHQARKIWEAERDIALKELARSADVSKRDARTWLRRWKSAADAASGEAEYDCKLYPSGKVGDAKEAQENFEKAIKRFPEEEQKACGSRLGACRFRIVDCRLPPTLRRMGRRLPSISPTRWVRTTAGECMKKRGRFYVVGLEEEVGLEPAKLLRPANPIKLMVLQRDGSLRELPRPERAVDDEPRIDPAQASAATHEGAAKRAEPSTAWERDADHGSACAQNYLGEKHRREGRYDKARRRFEEAAEQGYEKALINLGDLYERGWGVEQDPEAALACYEAATGERGMLLAGFVKGTPPDVRTRAIRAGKLEGPSIEVITPWIPRSGWTHSVDRDATEQRLSGRVFAPAEIRLLKLDDDVLDHKDGAYKYQIPLAAGGDDFDFELSAEDAAGKTDDITFTLSRDTQPRIRRKPERQGSYHALLIGIDDYDDDEEFGSLETPEADVAALGDLLAEKWGFESPKALLGSDATLENILYEFDRYRGSLGAGDNLLIYFAGHGQFLPKEEAGLEEGFWMPYDAAGDDLRTWISSLQIASQVESIRAGNVLIMADSCFSGFLTRSAISPAGAGGGSRSVSVLTSADRTEALDLAGEGNSPFAAALLEELGNWNDSLPASKLAKRVKAWFSDYYRSCDEGASQQPAGFCEALKKYGQEPQFVPIADGGHQGGEFILVPGSP